MIEIHKNIVKLYYMNNENVVKLYNMNKT